MLLLRRWEVLLQLEGVFVSCGAEKTGRHRSVSVWVRGS